MRIDCTGTEWQEAKLYFQDLAAWGDLERAGLALDHFDHVSHSVYLRQVDDDWDAMQSILESISAVSTRCTPAPDLAVSTVAD